MRASVSIAAVLSSFRRATTPFFSQRLSSKGRLMSSTAASAPPAKAATTYVANTGHVMAFVTAPSKEESKKIASAVVEKQLAACGKNHEHDHDQFFELISPRPRACVRRRPYACYNRPSPIIRPRAVNIVNGIESVYVWEGKVCNDSECLLVIKTTAEKQKDLTEFVHSIHPYDTPEVITYVSSPTSCVSSFGVPSNSAFLDVHNSKSTS